MIMHKSSKLSLSILQNAQILSYNLLNYIPNQGVCNGRHKRREIRAQGL
jgi:hypothetical protein